MAALFLLNACAARTSLRGKPTPILANAVRNSQGQIMHTLRKFEEIAMDHQGSRSVRNGYNASAEYIIHAIQSQTNMRVTRQYFKMNMSGSTGPAKLCINAKVAPTDTDASLKCFDEKTKQNKEGQFTVFDKSLPGNVSVTAAMCKPDRFGCDALDFSSADCNGRIAVIKRGNCTFQQRSEHALAHGAVGVIVYNEGNTGRRMGVVDGTLGSQFTIPVLGTSFSNGIDLLKSKEIWRAEAAEKAAEPTLIIQTHLLTEEVTTYNVIADSGIGDASNTVLFGSHLDSVEAGPGINDNGSGSATNLQVLLEFAKLFRQEEDDRSDDSYSSGHWLSMVPAWLKATPFFSDGVRGALPQVRNRVKFVWWGAEEHGLVGSKHFVREMQAELQAEQHNREHPGEDYESTNGGTRLGDIAAALNFDMIGSPNGIYGIYNISDQYIERIAKRHRNVTSAKSSSSSPPGPPPVGVDYVRMKNGNTYLRDRFAEWFEVNGVPFEFVRVSGRSDYGPFCSAGVPAGGVDAGADGTKTMAQRTMFGGLANALHDPCYHQACDTVENIDGERLATLSTASAAVLQLLATTPDLRAAMMLKNEAEDEKLQVVDEIAGEVSEEEEEAESLLGG